MKRILSIDGGGIKGVVPAAFLAQLEEALGESVTHFFDLIAGTSTGGIIALGLGLGMSAADILHFYERLGPAVFAGNRLGGALRRLGFAGYHAQPLRQALEATFGERRWARVAADWSSLHSTWRPARCISIKRQA